MLRELATFGSQLGADGLSAALEVSVGSAAARPDFRFVMGPPWLCLTRRSARLGWVSSSEVPQHGGRETLGGSKIQGGASVQGTQLTTGR
ncbi:hypothetical protein R1flu_011700 [Riccia fluitans]|uniref:Uncharacterized protein n=1 Tax=Riccia fluitans TaxID=41844 RepID=A0ABD1Z8J1_9MARC